MHKASPAGLRSIPLVGSKLVDLGVLELAGRNTVLEKNVKLAERAVLGLGKAEEGPDDADDARTEPEVAGLRAPVPSGRVEHIRIEDSNNDTADVV